MYTHPRHFTMVLASCLLNFVLRIFSAESTETSCSSNGRTPSFSKFWLSTEIVDMSAISFRPSAILRRFKAWTADFKK